MNEVNDTIEIDRIVSEVIRRLRTTVADAPAAVAPPAVVAPSRQLVLGDRVVSTAQLEGRLDGVQEVVIVSGAVVTPAARDELRKRQVRLHRSGPQDAPTATSRHCLVVDGDPAGTRQLIARLAERGIRFQSEPTAESLVRRCAGGTPDHGRAVLISDAWSRWLCEANRHASVCATTAWDATSLASARVHVAPNLLVLCRKMLSENQLVELILDFGK